MFEQASHPSETARISRTTLTAQLEEALRADILQGSLRPGERLRASDMTKRYGVSATPLREALQRLAMESLVELDPRLGATVARISEADVRDVYDMLQHLGVRALQRSIELGDEAWLRGVERSFKALSDATVLQGSGESASGDTRRRIGLQWSSAHWSFHQALYKACGSEWLLRFVETLHKHSERYRMLTLQEGIGMHRDSLHEHDLILRATASRDTEAAVAALRNHLQLTVNLLEAALADHRIENDPPESRKRGKVPRDPKAA